MDGLSAAESLRSLLRIAQGRSPLYERLLAGLAGAAERQFDGGVLARLLTTTGPADPAEARTLVLAALHHAALADPDLPHAAWYATARGDRALPATQGAPGALALAYLVEHEDEVAEFVATHRLQTNDVGRCANLLPGLLEAGRFGLPLRVVELGTSAGLNLRFDRYRYRYQDGPAWGPTGGPELRSRAEGAVPRVLAPPTLDITERIGVDLHPIDPTSPEGRSLLTCFIWPDEPDRHERLRGALTVAAATPATLVTDDLVRYAAESLAPVDGTVTVVVHSQVRHLLGAAEIASLDDALDRLLRAGRDDAPVVHVGFEAFTGTAPGDPLPEVVVGVGAGGGPPSRRTIATADWHGRWIRFR
jgi:hypothetical protein